MYKAHFGQPNEKDKTPADIDKIIDWCNKAKPNDMYTYHRGPGLYSSIMSYKLRNTIWDLAIQGDVYLVQRKHGIDDYEFIAIRASDPPVKCLVPDEKVLFTKEHIRKAIVYQNKQAYTHKRRIAERVN